MKFNKFLSKHFGSIVFAVILLTLSTSAQAQLNIQGVVALPPSDSTGKWSISVLLNTTIDKNQLLSISIIGVTLGGNNDTNKVPIDQIVYIESLSSPSKYDGFDILTSSIKEGTDYFLFIVLLDKNTAGAQPISLQHKITIPPSTASASTPTNQSVQKKNLFNFQKAEGLEDANIYISGNFVGARGSKPIFATELKLEKPLNYSKWTITPIFFKLKASSDPEADPDTMEIGSRFTRRFLFTRNNPNANNNSTSGSSSNSQNKKNNRFLKVSSAFWINEGKIEAERDFDNSNLIGSTQIRLRIVGPPIRVPFEIQPYLGVEAGKNLRSPVEEAEGKTITRIFTGVHTAMLIPFNSSYTKKIRWENTFIHRWPLKEEVGFKPDDNGNLIPNRFGRRPRSYFDSRIHFFVGSFFSPFISYDWGEEPPSYKFVNHRIKVGFTLKSKFDVDK